MTVGPNARPGRLPAQVMALLLVLAGLVVYWPGLSGSFIFDDYPNLVSAESWKVTDLEVDQWIQAASEGRSSRLGRPLAMLSFAANHYFTGLAPFPMKLTNLVMHLFNGLLVMLLCRQLFAHLRTTAAPGPHPSDFAAWMVALAWTLHPLQSSTVLYVVQRMEIGAQGMVLLAVLAYVRGRRAQIDSRRGWPWFALAAAAMAAGLGFKESALLAPGFAFLIEALVLRFAAPGAQGRSRVWLWTHGAGIALGLLVFLVLVLPAYWPASAYATRDFTLGERLLTQLPVLANYLRQIILPTPGSLQFYYDDVPVSEGLFSPPATALAALLAFLALVAMFRARRTSPLLALGIAWFLLGHALTSNVVPLELAFEHRNYLAILGVILALVPLLCRLGDRMNPDARTVSVLLLILALAILTGLQARTWGEPMRLAIALSTRNPDSPRASYELGKLLLARSGGNTGSPQWAMARAEFEHAAQLPGSAPLADQALVILDARNGRTVPGATWDRLRHKLTRRAAGAQEIQALHGVSTCRIRGGCALDDRQLTQAFIETLAANPRSPVLHAMYADYAFNRLRDPTLAIELMRQATRLAPDNPTYRAGLLKFLLASNLHDKCSREIVTLLTQLQNEGGRGMQNELQQIAALRGSTLECPGQG